MSKAEIVLFASLSNYKHEDKMLALEFIMEAVAWLITFAITISSLLALSLNKLQMNGYTFISAQKKMFLFP